MSEELDDLYKQLEEAKAPVKEEKSTGSLCAHTNKINNESSMICQDCGMVINIIISDEQEWRYYGSSDTRFCFDPSRASIRKGTEKAVNELSKYPFPDNIKNRINDIYLTVFENEILRGKSREGAILGCASEAYKECGELKTVDELAEMMKVTYKSISKGKNRFDLKFAEKMTNYTIEHVSPIHSIPKVLELFNATFDHVENVKILYKKIENRSSHINSSKPYSVAAALTFYYLSVILEKEITCEDFSKMVNLSVTTIETIYGSISEILKTDKKIRKNSKRRSAKTEPSKSSKSRKDSKEKPKRKEKYREIIFEE